MNKCIPMAIATTLVLAGCDAVPGAAKAGASPKLAAELCNAFEGGPTPAQAQAPVVADYQAGKISFDECMRRLRG